MWSLGSSHTHSSQHFPGSLTLRGKGQSGLGRRTSMLHRGTQPTAPSRQVHWYLQLLWKDSPLRYTVPPKTQGAPSLAEGEERKKGCQGSGLVLGPLNNWRVGNARWKQGSRGQARNSQRRDSTQAAYWLIFWREGGREGGGGRSLSVPGTWTSGGGRKG